MEFYKRLLIGSVLTILAIIVGGGWWWFNAVMMEKVGQEDRVEFSISNFQFPNNNKILKFKNEKNNGSIKENNLLEEKVVADEEVEENKEEEIIEETIEKVINNKILKVPFTVQAPYGDWSNSIYQDGCEESSVLMAMYWVSGEELTKVIADEKIVAMANWQEQNYGCYIDTSAKDTVNRLFNGYFGYENARVKNVNSINDLIDELVQGNLIIVPTNGQLLNNPYYTAPGPERHNLVVYGYDELTNEFITNDPGTKRGEAYRYSASILFEALRDYPSGCHVESLEYNKVMIIIEANKE